MISTVLITLFGQEIKLRDSTDEDVVLVSTESLRTLKLAYPNNFADTTPFRQNLRRLMAIGSPGVISSRVPHHPAYGSVQGGSNQTRAFGP